MSSSRGRRRKAGGNVDQEEHKEKKLKSQEGTAVEEPGAKEEHASEESEEEIKPARGRGRGRGKGRGRGSARGRGRGKGKGKVDEEEVKAEQPAVASHTTVTLETGHIFFFYRPKVELEDASSLDEVQRLFMILRPEDNTEHDTRKEKDRLIVIAKKMLPEIDSHMKHWGFVELVSANMDDIKKRLGPTTYQTKTMGERHLSGAKPCGSGVYSIVHHPGVHTSHSHTHLAYVLELPEEPGHLQEAFHIKKEASYIITVKNPTKPNPEQAGLQEEKKPHLPHDIQEEFHSNRFVPVEDIKLLNFEGTEIILIGAAKDYDVTKELGDSAKNLEATAEKEEHHPRLQLDRSLFEELAQRKKPEQIISGEW